MIVPAALQGVYVGAVFAFVTSWDELVVNLFVTSRNVYTLPRKIWDGIQDNVSPSIAAVATVLIIFTLCAMLARFAVQRRSEEVGESYSESRSARARYCRFCVVGLLAREPGPLRSKTLQSSFLKRTVASASHCREIFRSPPMLRPGFATWSRRRRTGPARSRLKRGNPLRDSRHPGCGQAGY